MLTKTQRDNWSKMVLLAAALLFFFQSFGTLAILPSATVDDAIEQIPEDTSFGQFVRFINTNWIITLIAIVVLLEILIWFVL